MPKSFGTPWTVVCQAPLSIGFFQTRISDWVAISFSKGSAWPKDQTHISCIGRQILYHWATKEALKSAILTHTPLLFRFPSQLGHHSVLSRVPCGIQYVLITYLFYTWKEWIEYTWKECIVTQSCPALCDPMNYSPTGSSVRGISRQEYWSGLPFPSPGDLPDAGIESESPTLQADSSSSSSFNPLKRQTFIYFLI